MSRSTVLEMATKTYYWKPMHAFFRSIELDLYHDSDVDFENPVLDLGCGDGGVIRILKETGLVKKPPYGIDISYSLLRKAKLRNEYLSIIQADANYLPFKDESFASIICNGVLCSILEGFEQPLKEANRILKKGGIFVATVPTDKFDDVLIIPKLLERLSHKLSVRYIKKLNNRASNFHMYSPQEWKKRIEDNGFIVLKTKSFFSRQAGFVWSILSIQAFRIFGLLSFIRNKYLVKTVSAMLENVFKKIYQEQPREMSDYGYIFIIARKV
jgi:ubiquinone/menaquinone biosynthesis C-methylase UbiE